MSRASGSGYARPPTKILGTRPNDQHYTTLGQTMLAQYHWLVDAGLLLAFSVGGLLYYLVFYRSERQNPGLFGEAGPA